MLRLIVLLCTALYCFHDAQHTSTAKLVIFSKPLKEGAVAKG